MERTNWLTMSDAEHEAAEYKRRNGKPSKPEETVDVEVEVGDWMCWVERRD
jgi:hypothetical protein